MQPVSRAAVDASPARGQPPVLEVRNVSKRFPGHVAVEDLSFEVSDGEFVFLIGPSGCGKTTALRMIGGYLDPTEGDIFIRGRRMNGVPLEKRNIGMVFQSYALFPHMTVAENVAFGLRMRRVPKRERTERVAAALDLVELRNLADRYPVQLSGGQRQRVAIGRVIAYEPDILLLDEPLANLDRRLRDQMRVELKKLQEKLGITTIYVTHDQEEALSMADRVAVMEGGRLLQLGTPSEVYNHPSERFVATFLGSTNSCRGRVSRITGGLAEVDFDTGMTITVLHAEEIEPGSEIMVSVRPERVRLTQTRPSDPHNVFAGTVEFLSYLGADVEYIIRLDGTGTTIKATEPLPTGYPSYAEGERVFVAWDPVQCICIQC